ncbi:PREDICTED: WD repeat-containing protein 70-like [Amphimedon queenslandica]|uniref:Uncharacterized protein n=1 Tax=Amphimedon queenslandica TaxID=400682 RepID=A0A1X7TJV7_AMPQE|nr:PREDICTED: WD repeat-containing protein 70-like [Amphimedon queenslandica]|eukprot:XP_019859155.1 PREDICTED: WD repeat-containing protein 70-like [Amphimedon queenslandica]
MSKEDEDISAVMGFSGFGRSKTARKFDIDAMFKETLSTAQASQVKDKPQAIEENEEEGDGMIGPPIPVSLSASNEEEEEEKEEEEEMGEVDDEFEKRFPLTNEVVMDHGAKPVSALGLDPAGARLITGCYGYDVKLWDFGGMDATLNCFRTLTPCGSHPICTAQYNHTGELILVASGNAQAIVMDRDGQTVAECPKGWQYIADMTNTNGHISMINNACWHPFHRDQFITCSNDCTVRVWEVEEAAKKQKHVIKSRSKQGKKTPIITCTYSRDGKYIAGAGVDGSIAMWKGDGPYVRPSLANYNAHVPDTETSCLCFAHDNHTLVSRGGDSTLKVWDIRKFRDPVSTVTDLFNHYSVTDCSFNPDETIIITGTSAQKQKDKTGELLFFDRSLNQLHKLTTPDSSVIRTLWHPKLNQIFIGCSSGDVKVFFSDKYSHRGPKMSLNKRKRGRADIVTSVGMRVLTPHALPMFRDEEMKTLKRQRQKERKDPILSHKPALPVTGKGVDGRVASGGDSSIGAYMRKMVALEKAVDKDEDPREALLKYAKISEENPMYVNPAYKKTQPVPVFQEGGGGDSDDEENS